MLQEARGSLAAKIKEGSLPPSPMVTLQLRQLDIPPGQRLLLHDVGWDEFEAILTELG